MNHILEKLNDEQLQTVTTDDKHVLILAGAGSGKTRAITAHIIYLSQGKKGVFKNKVITQIVQASTFYDAEEYHQDYYEKNGGYVCHTLREE